MEAIIERLVACFERGELSRRQLVAGVATLMAAAPQASAGEAAQQSPTFRAVGLNHFALRVSDIPRSRDFYIRHLGMEVMSESASSCFLRCGEHFVALFRREPAGMDHYCYSVEGYTVSGAAETLRAEGFEPRVTGNRIYFPDPDGIIVQLAAPGSMG
jgi:hypothetical protein